MGVERQCLQYIAFHKISNLKTKGKKKRKKRKEKRKGRMGQCMYSPQDAWTILLIFMLLFNYLVLFKVHFG